MGSETKITPTCFNCKWAKQGKHGMHCIHKSAIQYIAIKEPCNYCGRPPGRKSKGCGACIGRGIYAYPNIYDTCDCGGFEPEKKTQNK